MRLNEKILYYRKKTGLSQEALAAKVGVSRQAVSKWELGETTPDVEKLVILAKVFGVTTDELLGLEEPTRGAEQTAPQLSRLPEDVEWVVRRSAKFRRWYAPIYVGVFMLIFDIWMCVEVFGTHYDNAFIEETMRPIRCASAALAAFGAGAFIWGVVRLIRHRRKEKNGRGPERKS